MKLFVFPTNRALNDFYMRCEGGILPSATTIGGFLEEAIIVNGKTKIPKKLRKIILWDILHDFEIEKIGFDRTFLRFLEHSSFLFNFFDEIESAKLDIKNIDISDTYGDYEDHLRIIDKIYCSYQKRLDELNLYDNPTTYKLNTAYIKHYQHIAIYIDGLLSNRDFGVIKEIAKYSDIDIVFECSRYNKAIFEGLLGEEFVPNATYTININKGEIKSQKPKGAKKPNISLYGFSLRLNQAMLVIAKINQWLKEGVQNIAVVLPSEDFKKYLMLFDRAKNLNYAMGLEDTNTISKIRNLGDKMHTDPTKSKLANIIENVSSISQNLRDELLELKRFENLFESLSFGDILAFIAKNIKNIDDTNGGKVKVIGILETRGIAFDKVVIVDANDEFLPRINDDDMFINSNIRKKVHLPTIDDKENLQRHYYASLIENANEVCIAFHTSKIHSNLLDDFGIDVDSAKSGEELWSFFPKSVQRDYIEDRIIANIEDRILSATRIRTFLDCKRKFYFANIAKLTTNSDEKSTIIGNTIHDILKEIDSFSLESFQNALKQMEMDLLTRLDMEALLYKIKPFIESNHKILQRGREILHREFAFECEILGFRFSGRIDRIDKDGDRLYIIDYKVKNNFDIKNERFLQLLIYKGAIAKIYEGYAIEAAYYDVENNEIYPMDSTHEAMEYEALKEAINLLNEDNISFDKTSNSKVCTYCDYKYLCDVF